MIKSFKYFILTGLFASLLNGCIENDGNLTLANGIGGTGISTGQITGFGSIYLNGIKFNTDHAEFIRNNKKNHAQSDFVSGEVITIKGSINRTTKTGIADKVIYNKILIGPVTDKNNQQQIKLLNQLIITNQKTQFHGVKNISKIAIHDVIEVSGYTSFNSQIYATSIRYINHYDEFKMFSKIWSINTNNQTFLLANGYTINYSQADLNNLKIGYFYTITILGQMLNEQFIATSIKQNLASPTSFSGNNVDHNTINTDNLISGDLYDLEGLIIQVNNHHFYINNHILKVKTNTQYINGSQSDIKAGRIVQIKGKVDSIGTIIVSSVNFLW